MSYAIKDNAGNRIVFIQPQPDEVCEFCGKTEELRPYGPKGENICHECGMKDKEMTNKRMNQVLFGVNLDS